MSRVCAIGTHAFSLIQIQIFLIFIINAQEFENL